MIRAAVQPITVDEAGIYFAYIRHRPFFAIFTARYDTANHVLQTALAYLAAHLLGPTEFALRLPTLLAAPFYLLACWRIAFLAFRHFATALLAVGLLVLNPLILDYLSLARGYGIALTFFAWSLYFSLRYRMIAAGILAGLSAGANLIFVIPAIALALSLLSARFAGAALLSAGLVLARPLASARFTDFYFGATDALQSVTTLSNASLFYHGNMPLFPAWTGAYVHSLRFFDIWILPLVLAAIAAVLIARYRTAPVLRLTAGPLLLSIAALVIGHAVAGLKYPYDRTGIYLVFLFPLAIMGLKSRLRAGLLAPLVMVLGIYCLEFTFGNYAEWAYAADVPAYMASMKAECSEDVQIGGSPVFSNLIAFYREKHRWAQPLQRCEFYMLLPEDRRYADQFGLSVWKETRESILARPRK